MPRKHGPSAAVAFLKEFLPLIGWELCGWQRGGGCIHQWVGGYKGARFWCHSSDVNGHLLAAAVAAVAAG